MSSVQKPCTQTFDPYLKIKYAMLDAGLLSCSQVGFNIAMGSLAKLKRNVAQWLCSLDNDAEAWETPTLIRRDWVETDVWDNPNEKQWCEAKPLDHLLTPRPLMHLLNRLRHHPVDTGSFMVHGQCFRQEENPLPLFRQTTYESVEHVVVHKDGEPGTQTDAICEKLVSQIQEWGLPVKISTNPEGYGSRVALSLPETTDISLVRVHIAPPALLNAYKLDDFSLVTVGVGVERMCLAIVARFGVDPAEWPITG